MGAVSCGIFVALLKEGGRESDEVKNKRSNQLVFRTHDSYMKRAGGALASRGNAREAAKFAVVVIDAVALLRAGRAAAMEVTMPRARVTRDKSVAVAERGERRERERGRGGEEGAHAST